MQIITKQSCILTNHEVYAHLTSRRAASQLAPATSTPTATAGSQASDKKSRDRDRPPQRKLKAPNYEAISREILEYLAPQASNTHTTGNTQTIARSSDKSFPLPPYATTYSDENIQSLIRELAPFQLAEAEVLVLVNLRPRDLASLDAVVEEVDDRFDEATQLQILALVARWLGS